MRLRASSSSAAVNTGANFVCFSSIFRSVMVNATQVTVATIVCLVILIVSIALFAAAWSTLDVLEMGLDRNDFSKSISDKVYFSGRCEATKEKRTKKNWIFF